MSRRLNTFGKRGGGGRRESERTPTMVACQLVSLFQRQTATVLNLSPSGAEIRVKAAPGVGSEVFLVLPFGEVYARVIWRTPAKCGINFERSLGAFDIQLLKRAKAISA